MLLGISALDLAKRQLTYRKARSDGSPVDTKATKRANRRDTNLHGSVKMSETTMSQEVTRAMSTDKPKRQGRLGKLIPKNVAVPVTDDPKQELRRLVLEHKALTRKGVSIASMARDIKLTSGEVRECNLPMEVRSELNLVSESMKRRASKLEFQMLAQLKQIPIYQVFLSQVYGVGAVAAAYLVVRVDIHKAVKISQLRRFCGLAVINGRLERYQRGQQAHHVPELRTRLYQVMTSMAKNACRKTKDRPFGSTTKYLKVWCDYVNRMLHSSRYDASKNTLREWNPSDRSESALWQVNDRNLAEANRPNGAGWDKENSGSQSGSDSAEARPITSANAATNERSAAKAIIYGTAWRKACEVFLEDLYTVWRALEGQPVWGSYYAEKLGYLHGGQPAMRGPRMLTLEEALAMVGDVGPQALREGERLLLSIGGHEALVAAEEDDDESDG